MKKYILVILSLITALALLPIKATAAFAAENEIETGIFLPTSYLQYYKLDNPYAICRYTDEEGEEVVAISHTNEIIIYRDEKFQPIKLNLDGNQVKTIDHYGNYLVYVFNLNVYAVDMTGFNGGNWIAEEKVKKVDDKSGYDISIHGDKIAVSTESNIFTYDITTENGFSYSEDYTDSAQADKPSNILYSDSGIYYSTNNTGEIRKCGEAEPIKTGIDGIRSIAEGADGNIYYSCKKGIYNLNGETVIENVDAEDKDLGNSYEPRGICLTGKGMWVVDGAINAVQEIDLTDNSFTKFAITTNSKAINRLSASVKDLCLDGDKIYALDGDRIVVINDIDGVNTYNAVRDISAELFACGDDKILCYNSGKLYLYDITDNGTEFLDKTVSPYVNGITCTNVKSLCYSDGIFYVLTEYLKDDSKIYPIIKILDTSKLGTSKNDYELENKSSNVAAGKALKITADVFGNVYYAVEDGEEFKFYELGGTSPIYSRGKKGETLCKLQTDMDGKLYAEYSGNKIECYAGGEKIFSKTLKLSDNLSGMTEDSVSMCLSYNSETAYFLFKGLILKSSKAEDMRISTPGSISVPDGFSVGYDENTVFARLKDNSKTFSVTDKYEKYFDYTEMSVSKPKDYAVFEINDKYSLVISGGVRAIARNSDKDGETEFKLSPCDEELYMFAAVDFNAYSVPVEELSYKSASAKAHAKLLVLGEVTFNGNDYYAVKTENGNGYIRKQFLLSHLAKEKSEEEIRSAYIYLKGGAAVRKNADLSGESVLLSEKTKVKVLSIDGDVVKVEYDGGTWFTSKGNLYADGRQKTTKSLAVLLLALSLTTFALFFERRYLYRRGVNE